MASFDPNAFAAGAQIGNAYQGAQALPGLFQATPMGPALERMPIQQRAAILLSNPEMFAQLSGQQFDALLSGQRMEDERAIAGATLAQRQSQAAQEQAQKQAQFEQEQALDERRVQATERSASLDQARTVEDMQRKAAIDQSIQGLLQALPPETEPTKRAAAEAALRMGDTGQALKALGIVQDAPLVSMSGETERAKTEGKAIGEIETKTLPAIRTRLGQIQAMQQMLERGDVETGGIRQLALQGADFFNVPTEALADLSAFQSVANSAALTKSVEMEGNLSNADRQFVQSTLGGVGTSTEGNKAILEIQKKLTERERDMYRQMAAYQTRAGSLSGFDDYIADWAERNPLFTAEDQAEIGAMAAIQPEQPMGAAAAAEVTQPMPPQVGEVVMGYRYKGGDVTSPDSWERVQ